MNELFVKMLSDEAWFGLCVTEGCNLPITEKTDFSMFLDPHPSGNQFNTVLISNKGRYIWCDSGFDLKINSGEIMITAAKADIILKDGFENLKGAYLNAANEHFPANGITPPDDFFTKPQFNTWIELLHEQTQENILSYAKAVISNGFPAGILMIDAHWHEYHGSWKFHKAKFSDPKAMVDELHKMGFKVMLWTCPFISPDSLVYYDLVEKGYLVKNPDGKASIKEWWYGYSAVLDLTNPNAVNWYKGQLQELIDDYSIDGFKFDAGDAYFYSNDDLTYAPIDANGQSRLWAELGLSYKYNEYRASFQAAGLPLVQRLGDKGHSWGNGGMAALIPHILSQGIQGYSFTCPDMIGGGESGSFVANSKRLDEELFIRYAQCAALMPMMQFSAAPWRFLSEKAVLLCREAAQLHEKFADYVITLAHNAAKTGEPIVRYMEYEFPNEGLEYILDQFMLGSDILVAPVCKKGEVKRTVVLPKGKDACEVGEHGENDKSEIFKWKYINGDVYDGGQTVSIDAPIETLPYFILENSCK